MKVFHCRDKLKIFWPLIAQVAGTTRKFSLFSQPHNLQTTVLLDNLSKQRDRCGAELPNSPEPET
jgi:hypothetical protein